MLDFRRQRHSAMSFDSSVSYENLHMDYIAQLCSEGFSQSQVIRTLGITRNDIAMARDILQEFSSSAKTNESNNASNNNNNTSSATTAKTTTSTT